MIGSSTWILIIVLAPNPPHYDGVSNDVITFDHKQSCEKTRNIYISVVNQYWLTSRSYVSNCYRGK